MKRRHIYRANVTYTTSRTLELVASSLEEAEMAFEDGHGELVAERYHEVDMESVWDLGPAFDDM